MANIKAVKRNISKMIGQDANQDEIDLYLASEGLTTGDLKESKHTMERAGYQALGGAIGGAVASPGGATTPIGIGLGSAIGGQAYDLKQEYFGKKNTETLAERSKGAAEDFVLDVISPIAISKGVYGLKKAAGSVVGKARGVFSPSGYDVYRKFGIKPSAAMATRNKGFAVAEHALSDFPITADIFQKPAQENIAQLTLANRFLAKEYGPILSKEEIGMLFKKAGPEVLEHYSAVYNKLFSHVSKEIGENPQPIANTVGMLKTIVGETKAGPSSGVVKFAQEVITKAKKAGGGLPWEALKKHRTKIGDMLKSPELVSTRNIQSGDLKRLYAAMTQDMEAAAMGAGAKTHARWRAANKYFETKLTRDIPIIEDIIKKQYPEEVFDIIMRSSAKGGTRLRLLRKQLGEKKWSAVSGTILGKLGQQKAHTGVTAEKLFSPSTFMTNWNKLSEPAKRALFRGGRYEGLVGELNDFVKVAGDAKAVEQLANRSRTGSVLMFYGLFQSTAGATGAMLSGPGGLATGIGVGTMTVGLPRLTARLLTNQKFVRWLNKGFRIAKTQPNNMSVHLGRLMALRFKEDIQEDVWNVVDGVLGCGEGNLINSSDTN